MCGVKPLGGVLLEAPPDDAVEARWERRVDLREVLRLCVKDGADGVGGRRALKRPPAGQHLVEHCAEREHIGALIDREAAQLLRRHVANRSEHRSRRRASDRWRHRRERSRIDLLLCQPKIEDFGSTGGGDEDVLGLEIAVDDPLLVRRREAMRKLQGIVDGLALLEAVRERRGQAFAKGFTLEQLHHGECHVVRVPDVVNRQDVRMRDGRDGFGFPLEALALQRVASERRRENLDGNRAIEPAVARLVDLAHAAGPDRRHDFVRTEPCTWRNRHVGETRL